MYRDHLYRDPDISWDGRRVLFAYKATQKAMTWIYEIGADGKNLKRLTSPEPYHDIPEVYYGTRKIQTLLDHRLQNPRCEALYQFLCSLLHFPHHSLLLAPSAQQSVVVQVF